MIVRQIETGALSDFAYLVVDEPSRRALVVDPSGSGAAASSTIGAERKTHYTLEPRSGAEFVAFMAEP